MAEWTPEAEKALCEYLDHVSKLSAAKGDDAKEIVDSLRCHIVTEVEENSGSVVTLEDIQRELALVGTPGQVVGVDSVDTKKPPTRPVAGAKGRENEERPWLSPKSVSRRAFIWLAAVLLPAGALFIEATSGTMAGIYLDPIPSFYHLIALSLIPVSIAVTDIFLIRAGQWKAKYAGLLCIANGYASTLSIVYFLAYIPTLPISTFCIIAMGLGFLGFAPLFCMVASMRQGALLRRKLEFHGLDRKWINKRRAVGFLILLVLAIVVQGPVLLTEHAMKMAMSDDTEEQEKGLMWLRTLHAEDKVLEKCYRRARSGILAPDLEDIVEDWNNSRELYYRMTGQSFNSVPRPATRPFVTSSRRWNDEFMVSAQVGGTSVAGRVSGLGLDSSVMDINLTTAGTNEEGPSIAYIEWIMEFRNTSRWNAREARGQIEIPHDAVASRLTLWVNGEEQEAAFGTRSKVREAYQDVAVVRRRDPALLNTCGPDKLLLQCFPVPPDGSLKVKIGISAPLVERDGRAYLRLPSFSERNFAISDDLEHRIWLESTLSVESGSSALTREESEPGVIVLRGSLTEQSLQDPSMGTFSAAAPSLLGDRVYASKLGDVAATMTVGNRQEDTNGQGRVCLIVDGSAKMNNEKIIWKKLLDSLADDVKINAVFAGHQTVLWREDFDGSREELGMWLDSKEYWGGCDAIPAIEKALEILSEQPGGVLLWIHAPLPARLSSGDGLAQWMRRRPANSGENAIRFLSVSVVPGPNRLVEDIGYLAGIERVAVIGSVDETLSYVARNLASEDIVRRFSVESLSEERAEKGAIRAEASKHIVRLAVGHVARLDVGRKSADHLSDVAALAVKTRLVTPLTGAVVLEQMEQYVEHDLDPGANQEAIPVIPEPEEWALIIVVLCAFAYTVWRFRRGKGAAEESAC